MNTTHARLIATATGRALTLRRSSCRGECGKSLRRLTTSFFGSRALQFRIPARRIWEKEGTAGLRKWLVDRIIE